MNTRSLVTAALILVGASVYPVSESKAATATNVVALGDSITVDQCCGGSGSWRVPLRANLSTTDTPINFVGNMSDSTGAFTAKSGASTCDFFSSGRPDFYAALGDIRNQGSAKVAIIDIGTNDYITRNYIENGFISPFAPYSCPSSLGSFGRFYDAIVYNPNLSGVVITTIESANGANLTDFENAIIAKYVADRQSEGRNVCLATLPQSFVGLTNPGDAYHLSAYGKQVVADALVAPTQRAIMGQCASTQPPVTTVVTTSAPTTTAAPTTTSAPTTTAAPSVPVNVALGSAATASSESSSTLQLAAKAVDGIANGYPGDYAREWATIGGGNGSWIETNWGTLQSISRVVLYDRPNLADQITQATITFSDGTTITTGPLNNDGSPTTITFPARTATKLRLTVTATSPTTTNVGLAELQAWTT